MLPLIVIETLFHISEDGTSPFEKWFSGLSATAAAEAAKTGDVTWH